MSVYEDFDVFALRGGDERRMERIKKQKKTV